MRGERKTEILNYRPPLFAASALIAGILLGALLRNTFWGLIASIAVSVAFAAVAFLKKYKVLRLALVFAVLGMVVVTSFFAVIAPETDPGFGYVRGRVKDVGKSYYGYTRYVLEDVTFNGEKAGGNLYLKSASELETGDIVEFAAVTEAVNPDPFDTYSSTYYENGISFEAECDFVSIKGKDKLTLFEKFGLKLKEVLIGFAGEESGGVLKGLLLGGDENIDSDTVEYIRSAGLSHVLSVSGLHVGFLCAMIYAVFRLFGRPPKKALTVLAILLPVYAAMTGFAPGVVRASITALVFLFSLRTGRRFDALNALSLSAIIILLIWPWALFDLSFQMSFAAVLGIILFMNPIIRAFKPKSKISIRLCSAAALSVSANVLLLGLTASVFGTFAIYFLPANLIAVPYVSLIYFLAVPTAFLSTFIPFMGYLLIPIGYLTQGFILFSGAVSALPGAVAAVEMPFAASIVWSFGWVFVSDVNLLNKRIKTVTCGVCLALFTLLLFA